MVNEKNLLIEEDKDDYHIQILKIIKYFRFSVGKTLLIDFLVGNDRNKSVIKNDLDNLEDFGSFKGLDESEIEKIIDNLISNNLLQVTNTDANRFHKILKLTEKGEKEISNPSLNGKKLKNNYNITESVITEEDKEKFHALDIFLHSYNDEQKKAIIETRKNILCIAGPGSGKTSVLTKRIEFLVKYRAVDPKKILAVTFTRKAKQEMASRLLKLGIQTNVETFNSFSEKILQKYSHKVYDRPVKVASFGDKSIMLVNALQYNEISLEKALSTYFSPQQMRNKTPEQLRNSFMNDLFFILDYFKSKNQQLYDFSKDTQEEKESAKLIYQLLDYMKKYMDKFGLRDYTDQILDTIKLFKQHPNLIPRFEHILIDEYQDINEMQINLIDLLKTTNLFVVGDPRQSIYGWRGSDINKILTFHNTHEDAITISLNKNYRSSKNIVDFMNLSIKDLQLPDIKSVNENPGNIRLMEFDSEDLEHNFVIQKILSSDVKRQEIFVLARTNRQLNELSEKLKKHNIDHIVKTEDTNNYDYEQNKLTLSTIHAIKGLEAEMVFVIGCNQQNFPSQTSDHPLIDLIKIKEYDKEEEEKRVFYTAISRAKSKLYLTYSGKLTYFITDEMESIF